MADLEVDFFWGVEISSITLLKNLPLYNMCIILF